MANSLEPAPKVSWLLRFRPRPEAAKRLVCFGPAGGGASFFRAWPDRLTTDTELIAVQLPGREARLGEPPGHRIVDTAVAVERKLAELPQRPTVLFGHSMGALIAYEVARTMLRRRVDAAVSLVVSGREAPDRAMRDATLVTLPDDAFLQEVAGRYGGIPAAVMQVPELRELFIPALRADFIAVLEYRHQHRDRLDAALTVLRGTDDPQTADPEIDGWQGLSTQLVRVREFSGGHFYLVQHVDAVVAEVLSAMPMVDRRRRVQAATHGGLGD